MAYNDNIPQPTDKLKDSQNDILQNFSSIKSAFDTNHVTFDLADEGKHKYVSFPEQVAGPATGVNERAIYAKQSSYTGLAELYTREESSGAEIEFTGALKATPGWTILPSGIILKWGWGTANGAYTLVLPAGATIPAFTTIFSVQVSVLNNAAGDVDEAIRVVNFANPLQIDVYGSNRSTTGATPVVFEYFAIGE